MARQSILTQETFDSLLAWLDPDRARSALRYEEIRESLIKIFTWRGVVDAEGLADETINRVAGKVQELKETYRGDPALYFYGVAKKLLLEYERQQHHEPLIPQMSPPVSSENELEGSSATVRDCLRECLGNLSPEDRDFILDYYAKTKQAKIDYRKELAEKLGMKPNALRVRVHRLRATIKQCIKACLEGKSEEY